MKRLLFVGLSLSLGSFMPILSWVLMSLVYNEPEFSNGMTYTYPYQFIFMFLVSIFATGQLKNESRNNKTDDGSKIGIILVFILMLLLSILSICNIGFISSFIGFSSSVSNSAFKYGLIALCIDWAGLCYTNMLQYKNNDKLAAKLIVIWYVVKISSILITSLSVFNYITGPIFVLVIQFINLMIYTFLYGVPKRIRFRLTDGIKYSLDSLASCPAMAIIYIFGLHTMGTTDIAVLSAFNAVVLCTDTQWDIQSSAIETVVTGIICDKKFENNRLKVFMNSVLYSFVLLLSSCILMLIYIIIDPSIALNHMFIIFAWEMCLFVIWGISCTMDIYIAINNPCVWIIVFTAIKYIFRITVQFIIVSPYSTSIAVALSGLVDMVLTYMLYRVSRRKVLGVNVNE